MHRVQAQSCSARFGPSFMNIMCPGIRLPSRIRVEEEEELARVSRL